VTPGLFLTWDISLSNSSRPENDLQCVCVHSPLPPSSVDVVSGMGPDEAEQHALARCGRSAPGGDSNVAGLCVFLPPFLSPDFRFSLRYRWCASVPFFL